MPPKTATIPRGDDVLGVVAVPAGFRRCVRRTGGGAVTVVHGALFVQAVGRPLPRSAVHARIGSIDSTATSATGGFR